MIWEVTLPVIYVPAPALFGILALVILYGIVKYVSIVS